MPIRMPYNPDRHRAVNNFAWLFAALMLLILFPLIATFTGNIALVFTICYSLSVISGIYIVTSTRKHLIIGLLLGLATIAGYWFRFAAPDPSLRIWQTLLGFSFFTYLAYHLGLNIVRSRTITMNLLFGSVAGYLIIGLVGGQLCVFLEAIRPGSFNLPQQSIPYDLFYFSYVSLTSVGYGDITPATPGARAIALLISLSGQLYLTILVAILIGKYLSESPEERRQL